MTFIAALMLAHGALAADTKFVEGKHYEVRSNQLTKTKEIREFFSFFCGHCFSLQDSFARIEKAFPNAVFAHNPVPMLGGPMGPELQRAYAVAANLGMDKIFTSELFESMHRKNIIPRSHAEVVAFAASIGIPRDRFERDFNSFPMIGKVAEFDRWDTLIKIDAVPELLVNGKYMVTMENISTEQEMIDLINYLFTLDNLPDAPKAKVSHKDDSTKSATGATSAAPAA